MKYVVCPPCGTVFEGETEQEVIRTTQLHAKEKHDYVPPREEILNAMISSSPPSGGENNGK
jgi:predicted small metal-binding protein